MEKNYTPKDKLMVNQMVKVMLYIILVNGNTKEPFRMVKHMAMETLSTRNKDTVFKENGSTPSPTSATLPLNPKSKSLYKILNKHQHKPPYR
jgi:hypothetical protein